MPGAVRIASPAVSAGLGGEGGAEGTPLSFDVTYTPRACACTWSWRCSCLPLSSAVWGKLQSRTAADSRGKGSLNWQPTSGYPGLGGCNRMSTFVHADMSGHPAHQASTFQPDRSWPRVRKGRYPPKLPRPKGGSWIPHTPREVAHRRQTGPHEETCVSELAECRDSGCGSASPTATNLRVRGCRVCAVVVVLTACGSDIISICFCFYTRARNGLRLLVRDKHSLPALRVCR